MRKVLIFLAFLTPSIAFPAQDDNVPTSDIEQHYLEIYSECLTEHGGPRNATVDGCSNHVSFIVEAKISKLIESLQKNIARDDIKYANSLIESQSLWEEYRDKHCTLMGIYVGSPFYGYCPMQLNIKRLEELTELSTTGFFPD